MYQQNRANISVSELQKHNKKWVAFSPDGRRVIASSDSIPELTQAVQAAGEDPQNAVIEWIEIEPEEVFLGGAELL